MKHGWLITIAFVSLSIVGKDGLASFDETWDRYPSPDSYIVRFEFQFPDVHFPGIDPDCKQLTSENRLFLGDNSPESGEPVILNPSGQLSAWLARCTAQYIRHEVNDLDSEGPDQDSKRERVMKRYAGNGVFLWARTRAGSRSGISEVWPRWGGSWNDLDRKLREELIAHNLVRAVGDVEYIHIAGKARMPTEVIADLYGKLNSKLEGGDRSIDVLRIPLGLSGEPQLTVRDAAKVISFALFQLDSSFRVAGRRGAK